MTDADERFGAAQGQHTHVDFRLIPQLKPAGVERFGDIDRRGRRHFGGQQRAHTVAQILAPKRRSQGGQHRNTKLPAELLHRRHHKQIGGPEQQGLAVKLRGFKSLHNLAGLDPACRQPDHDKVGELLLEHRG